MSATEPVTVDALQTVVLAALTDTDRAAHATYSRAEVVRGGTSVDIAGLSLSAPIDFLVAFIDDSPGGNWSHPCRYLVATRDGTTATPADWPPVMGPLPPPWQLLHRGRDVEDWQVLPVSPD